MSGERSKGIVRRVIDGKLSIDDQPSVAASPGCGGQVVQRHPQRHDENGEAAQAGGAPHHRLDRRCADQARPRLRPLARHAPAHRQRSGQERSARFRHHQTPSRLSPLRAGVLASKRRCLCPPGGKPHRKDNEDRQRFVRGDMLAHLGSGAPSLRRPASTRTDTGFPRKSPEKCRTRPVFGPPPERRPPF